MRFAPRSVEELRAFKAASGNIGCFVKSDMLPGANFGVSKSSMANSGRGLPALLPQNSDASDGLRLLIVEDGRELIIGLPEGGGIEMLARSACTSVVPGSACRLFLLVIRLSPEADERL